MKSNIVHLSSLQEITEVEDPVQQEENVRRTLEPHALTYESLQDQLSLDSETGQHTNEFLQRLKEIKGFVAAAVAHAESGKALETLGSDSGFDIEVAVSANSNVIEAKLSAVKAMGLGTNEKIEDILITLNSQYHLIRFYSKDPNYFIYLALDKSQANLAMARRSLTKAEQSLDF